MAARAASAARQPAGHLVVGPGGLQAALARWAGLVRAASAHLCAVALVVGGDVQHGEHGADVGAAEDDGVLPGLPADGQGRRHRDEVSAGRVVLGAFADAGQVADEADGAAGVQVVAADVAVPVQRVRATSGMKPEVIRWSLVIGGPSG